MKPAAAHSDPSQKVGTDISRLGAPGARPPRIKTRRNLLIGLLAVVAMIAGIIFDYNKQQERIQAIEDRIDLVNARLDSTSGEPTSLRALRALLVTARDDATVIPRRWIGSRQDAAWDYADQVEDKLRRTEQRYGIKPE